MRIIMLLIFGLLINYSAMTQDTISVATFCHSYGNSIAVRWQPYRTTGWNLGKKYGYKLTRLAYANGDLMETKELGRFKFLPKSDWSDLLINNPYASVPYEAAYDYVSPITDLSNINNVLYKNKEEENILIFNLLYANFNFEVATAMGLGYMDKDLKNGFRYEYKVEYVNSQSYKQTTPIVANLAKYPISYLPKIDSLAIQTEDSLATLRWNFIDFEEKYVAYFIERSLDGGNTFQQVNKTPFVPLVDDNYGDPNTRYIYFNDDSLANNITYHYRIRGLSYFGDSGPPSNMVTGTPKPAPIQAKPIITDVWEDDNGHFKVSWFFDPNYLSRVKYFEVQKSNSRSTSHEVIKNSSVYPEQDLVFVDSFPSEINFYKIKAIDNNDHEIYSIAVLGQLQDKTPPSPPTGIQGTCDSNNIVTILWTKNKEPDLAGYYVYYSNTENGDYSILTQSGGLRDSFFQDTISLDFASERSFYKVVAHDFRGNQSDFSRTIFVKLPDNWPPVKPVFKRHRTQIGQLFLEWTNSSSYDISRNILERRILDSLNWMPIVIDSTRGTTVSFLDTMVNFNNTYEYRIQAIDDDSLFVFSDTLALKPLDDRKRNLISDFEVIFKKDKQQIHLSWKLNVVPDQIKKISIFRGAEGSLIIPYKTRYTFLEETDFEEFMDKEIQPNKAYQYKILVRFKDGTFATSEIKNSTPK